MIKFKCRCASQFGQRMAYTPHMGGTWKIHHSLIQQLHPPGLHRVYYQLKENDLDNLFSDDGWIEVKYRNSNKVPRFNPKDFQYAYG